MRRMIFCVLLVGFVTLLVAPAAYAQRSEGRIFGSTLDPDGIPLPGVTVTLTSPGMMGDRVAFTGAEGGFRFPAIPPATYTLTTSLQGFRTVVREDIEVPVGVTLTLTVTMEVAAVEETITVLGESPLIDIKSSDVGASFNADNLKNVPTATDMWAILAMTPGVRMEAYDVGGSHKSQQLSYESFGVSSQNRIMTEGMDSTEGGGGTGFYFDYYSKDDVRVVGATGDVEMTTGGAYVIQNIKTGSNEYHGTIQQSYENRSMIRENVDAATEARGFTGNPNRLFWESHGDVGGAVVQDRLWFYGSFNAFKIDKVISGVDPAIATDIGRIFVMTGKLSWRPTDMDQLQGFGYWQLKEKPNRGLSNTCGPDCILAQNSWSRMWNGTWERTWSDNLFTDITAGVMGFSWPMVAAVDPKTNPPRIDDNTGVRTGAGYGPFIFNRYKPQTRGSAYYFTDAVGGTHDFKLGYDFMIDSAQFGRTFASGGTRYVDDAGTPIELVINNYPQFADDRNLHTDLFAQDTWTLGSRVTINAGVRFQRQKLYYVDGNSNSPIRNVIHPDYGQIGWPVGTIEGQDVHSFDSLAPRLGVNIDLMGDGRIAIKAAVGRYHFNVNDSFGGVNPGGSRSQVYEFNDLDGNGLWDCDPLQVDISGGCTTAELGTRLSGQPGTLLGTGTTLDPNIALPYTDEISLSVELQIIEDSALRIGFVRKSVRDSFGGVNSAREGNLSVNFTAVDHGLDGVTGTADDGVLNLRTIPESAYGLTSSVLTNYPRSDQDYDNLEVAFQKRFRGTRAFVLAGFDYGTRRYMPSNGNSTSPLSASPLGYAYELDVNRDTPIVQDSTTWGFKAAGHFVLPQDIGLGVNMQVNSGWNYARLFNASFPGMGRLRVFTEAIENNRSDTVPLINIRLDRRFALPHGTFTLMGDFYNIMNSNAVLNFQVRSGSAYNTIIQALDPMTFMLGLRYEY